MNDIIYAGAANAAPARTEKVFRVLLPDKEGEIGEIKYSAHDAVVLPPSTPTPREFSGNLIAIERALIALKSPVVFQGREKVEFIYLQLTRTNPLPERRSGMIFSALGELLAAYVTAYCTEREFSPAVEIMREEIERNLSNTSFSLEDYIKTLPLNYDYLRKLFKSETGATPHDYLISRRMRLASNILSGGISNRYSEYSVAQVAEACGFSEPLYFSRVFKKYFGVAPSDYRKTR